MEEKFDLFVIGGGSGGVRAARQAAQSGASVGLAEGDRYGGTCVIRGCVPKKLYVYAARFHDEFEIAKSYGWRFPAEPVFDWNLLTSAKEKEISRLEEVYKNLLKNSSVQTFSENAVFEDEDTIRLKPSDRLIKAKTVLIAVGGKPAMLTNVKNEVIGVTSDEIFDLPELPESILIYGGGYIGVEFAGIFRGLGLRVTLAVRGDGILKGFDSDIRAALTEHYQKSGVEILTGVRTDHFVPNGKGVAFDHAGKQRSFPLVLSAIGRRPNTEFLQCERAGLKLEKNGAVTVNDYSQTNKKNIYAIGDVTDRLNLTPVAIDEAMCFKKTVFDHIPTAPDYENVPTAVFSDPEISTVGMTERVALESGYDLKIYEARFRPMKYAFSNKEMRTYMKMIVCERTDLVLGVHLFGPDTAEIIQIAAIAVKAKLKKSDFDNVRALHPTVAEELVTMRVIARNVKAFSPSVSVG